jgi:hypothetical protein
MHPLHLTLMHQPTKLLLLLSAALLLLPRQHAA